MTKLSKQQYDNLIKEGKAPKANKKDRVLDSNGNFVPFPDRELERAARQGTIPVVPVPEPIYENVRATKRKKK